VCVRTPIITSDILEACRIDAYLHICITYTYVYMHVMTYLQYMNPYTNMYTNKYVCVHTYKNICCSHTGTQKYA